MNNTFGKAVKKSIKELSGTIVQHGKLRHPA